MVFRRYRRMHCHLRRVAQGADHPCRDEYTGKKRPGQRRALERKPPAMPRALIHRDRFVDDSFSFQLVAQSDPDMFGRSDLFGAESGRHGVDRLKIRGKCAASFAAVHVRVGKLRQGPVRVLFENLFQFIALHVRYPSSLAVNPTPPILSWRPGVPAALDHAEFPVRVLAAAFAPCAIAIWNSRSNSSSARQSHCAQNPEYHAARKPAYSRVATARSPVRDARGQSSRSSQVENADSPRNVAILRNNCKKASWVRSSASEVLPTIRKHNA